MNANPDARDILGTYEEKSFPVFRYSTLDTLTWGRKKHHIPCLFEVDVTQTRQYLSALKTKTGESLSFTGWVVKCIAQALSEHQQIQAMRKGRNSLILFDDVDISVVIERAVDSRATASETLPMPYLIRKANEKSVREIHAEIRWAQNTSLEPGEVQIGGTRSGGLTKAFNLMPQWVRDLLVWRRLVRDPFFAKKMMGTVVVTSTGSSGNFRGYGWTIPIGIHPVVFALGSIARKPGVVGEEIKIREYLSVTLLFDHDVIDGAPVVRFLQRLQALLEHSYGLI